MGSAERYTYFRIRKTGETIYWVYGWSFGGGCLRYPAEAESAQFCCALLVFPLPRNTQVWCAQKVSSGWQGWICAATHQSLRKIGGVMVGRRFAPDATLHEPLFMYCRAEPAKRRAVEDCGDPECDAERGFAGFVMQPALREDGARPAAGEGEKMQRALLCAPAPGLCGGFIQGIGDEGDRAHHGVSCREEAGHCAGQCCERECGECRRG